MCDTTDFALNPKPGVVWSKPAECPVNGFGGSWYRQQFDLVPVYNRGAEGVVNQISFADIDEWAAIISNDWITSGTCLGLCILVLSYVVTLTPNNKRGKPFHTILLLAILSEIGRLLCDVTRASNIGLSPYSAYLGLTNDFASTTYSPGFQGLAISGMIFATLAFLFTCVCLYIQACGLLTGLRINHRNIYIGIIIYLVTACVVALALRITITVIQAMTVMGADTARLFPNNTFYNLRRATGIAYAISLGSWCLVSLASVVWLMFTRTKLIVTNRPYDTALTILSLVFVESFIVPLIFILLQSLPAAEFGLAELVVIPSVLVLLPLGSLFMTVHSANAGTTCSTCTCTCTSASGPRLASVPVPASPAVLVPELESHLPLAAGSVESIPLQTLPARAPLAANPVDRELQLIDNMGESEEEEPIFGQAGVERVLSFRARRVRGALAEKGITGPVPRTNLV